MLTPTTRGRLRPALAVVVLLVAGAVGSLALPASAQARPGEASAPRSERPPSVPVPVQVRVQTVSAAGPARSLPAAVATLRATADVRVVVAPSPVPGLLRLAVGTDPDLRGATQVVNATRTVVRVTVVRQRTTLETLTLKPGVTATFRP